MHIETERKFLVRSDAYKALATASHHIRQGYIAHDGGNTVRVRLWDELGVLTIKGRSLDGISRPEWEKEIPLQDALDLFPLCHGGNIDKTRYIVPASGNLSSGAEGSGELRSLRSLRPLPQSASSFSPSADLQASLQSASFDNNSHLAGPSPYPCPGVDTPPDPSAPSASAAGSHTLVFEVDEFHGANEGLVMAEIELPAADTPFPRPDWLGEEVTGDKRYYNSYLTQHPFTTW